MSRTISARFSANISIMFTEVPYLERPSAAADAGFQTIETWWPFPVPEPDEHDVVRFLDAIRASGTALRGMNFFAGDMANGERGVACLPDRQEELQRSTEVLVRVAAETGCRSFNLLYGRLDERWSRATQENTAIKAFQQAAARIAPFGGQVLLEPLASGLNGTYPLTDCAQIAALLEGSLACSENVRLLFDTFHLGSNGVDIVESVHEYGDFIGHVQLADAPGRAEPGTGGLPIGAAIEALDGVGYAGYLACEYRPSVATRESLGWLLDSWAERSTSS